jgi:hypothetical protein
MDRLPSELAREAALAWNHGLFGEKVNPLAG